MRQQVRNDGSRGIASMAISALDIALWDLKAKLLGSSLVDLLGAVHKRRGGLRKRRLHHLQQSAVSSATLRAGLREGLRSVKMKIGAEPRPRMLRGCVWRAKRSGRSTSLFVDANGAYDAATGDRLCVRNLKSSSVTWFEEPVSSDDLTGLRRVRDERSGRYGDCSRRIRLRFPYTSAGCSKQKQSMSCNWMRRDARALPDS